MDYEYYDDLVESAVNSSKGIGNSKRFVDSSSGYSSDGAYVKKPSGGLGVSNSDGYASMETDYSSGTPVNSSSKMGMSKGIKTVPKSLSSDGAYVKSSGGLSLNSEGGYASTGADYSSETPVNSSKGIGNSKRFVDSSSNVGSYEDFKKSIGNSVSSGNSSSGNVPSSNLIGSLSSSSSGNTNALNANNGSSLTSIYRGNNLFNTYGLTRFFPGNTGVSSETLDLSLVPSYDKSSGNWQSWWEDDFPNSNQNLSNLPYLSFNYDKSTGTVYVSEYVSVPSMQAFYSSVPSNASLIIPNSSSGLIHNGTGYSNDLHHLSSK